MMFALQSCSDVIGSGNLDEGLIEYEITYPNPPDDKYVQKMLPTVLDFKFKRGLTKSEVSISLGMIKIFYLTDVKKKTMTEMVKFMTNKYSHEMDIGAVEDLMSELPPYTIEQTEDTKMIANYKCKKATVYVGGKEPYTFDLYYTNEIDIPEANWYNPFKEIEGVLMEYEIERFNMLMHLTASKVEPAEFENDEFMRPKEYDPVDKSEMDKVQDMFEELNQ